MNNYDLARYKKLYISIRYWLIGKSEADSRYLTPLKALEFSKEFTTGLRKDGITPEFQHQIEIAHFLRTLHKGLLYPAETIACAFLHDLVEDHGVSLEEIEKRFGILTREGVDLVTKEIAGTKRDEILLFDKMAENPISSVLKGADRINNHQSMHGAFSFEKQQSYLNETKELIIPMLKKARHLHVEQESIYENIKFILNSQIQLIEQKIELSIALNKNIAQKEILTPTTNLATKTRLKK